MNTIQYEYTGLIVGFVGGIILLNVVMGLFVTYHDIVMGIFKSVFSNTIG